MFRHVHNSIKGAFHFTLTAICSDKATESHSFSVSWCFAATWSDLSDSECGHCEKVEKSSTQSSAHANEPCRNKRLSWGYIQNWIENAF